MTSFSAASGGSFQFSKYVQEIEKLYRSGLTSASAGASVSVTAGADSGGANLTSGQTALVGDSGHKPVVLIYAPHPDDECLMAAYPLRLMLESNASVYVIPFSLGSNPARQAERDQELNRAIDKLGFKRVTNGVSVGGAASSVANDAQSFLKVLNQVKPSFVFSPHAEDGHGTHQKTYQSCKAALELYLAVDAQGAETQNSGAHASHHTKTLTWVQTEFWQNLPSPNLLVSLSTANVITIGEALMEHKGEIARNPYHLRLPAWYMDQVRRGSERVIGAGAHAVPAVFGQAYTQVLCKGADSKKWTLAEAVII